MAVQVQRVCHDTLDFVSVPGFPGAIRVFTLPLARRIESRGPLRSPERIMIWGNNQSLATVSWKGRAPTTNNARLPAGGAALPLQLLEKAARNVRADPADPPDKSKHFLRGVWRGSRLRCREEKHAFSQEV